MAHTRNNPAELKKHVPPSDGKPGEPGNLDAHRDSGFDAGAEMKTKTYTVTIISDKVNTDAATDNSFYLTITGDKGTSSQKKLLFEEIDQKEKKQYQRHKLQLEAEDVGRPKKVKVEYDNNDNGTYRWYLGTVKIDDGKDKILFRFNQWIDQYSGLMTIEISEREKSIVDNWTMDFKGDGVRDSMSMSGLRSIKHQKKGLDEDSAAFKLLSRAEEIQNDMKFIEMKEKHREYLLSTNLMDDYFEERLEEMAIDIAEREDELVGDLMQFERAGLSKKEQAKIPKLDETNNPCYAYLRSHGNMWKYDPTKYEPRYKARLYRRFDTFDKDSDGFMLLSEVLLWADRMRSICDTDEMEVENVRNALDTYFSMYGLRMPGGLHRENWCEAHITMGEASKERMKQGDPIPMKYLAKSYFDVIDEDDNGVLNMQELRNMMNVFRVPEESAYTFFERADADKNGLLEMEEMHKLFWAFWFEEYDETMDNIFAYKY